jgi:hypothetical protein
MRIEARLQVASMSAGALGGGEIRIGKLTLI